jgi:molybdopterin/thiamine biosynthesis adenylyltransferase
MRRWNLLYVAAPLAAVLITLSGQGPAMATVPNENNFKGKAAVYSPGSDSYYVVSFTCSNKILSGKWTFDNGASYSGTLTGTCSFNGTSDITVANPVKCVTANCESLTSATLNTLELTNITATKTYVPTVSQCPDSRPCIVIKASVNGTPFISATLDEDSYGTLTIQLEKRPEA